jgi:diguanylate cyclase (GGDEF)-like protein
MFDIDHFKSINDQLGHLRGDDLLRSVGTQLTKITRSSDVRCRYGGDEFLVILPDTPQAGAEQVAECIRREIASLNIPGVSDRLSITASLGVAVVAPGDADVTEVIERADAALYQAKRGGRNRFAVSTVGLAAAGPAKVLSLPQPIAASR